MVAVVAGGGDSREITGAGCAAGFPGARMAGAAGAAVTADVKKEKISATVIELICFFEVKIIKASTKNERDEKVSPKITTAYYDLMCCVVIRQSAFLSKSRI